MVDRQIGSYAAAVSLALLYYSWNLIRRRDARRPPSPLSLPFVGNLFSIPSGHEYLVFTKLGEQLKSDIIHIEIFGHKILVLNSPEAVYEVLEKRSAIYSDRPVIPMLTDPALMNWSGLLTLAGYGDRWRHYRRIMNNWLNIRAVAQFDGLQERQARLLLRRLLRATNSVQPFERVKNEFFFTMGESMFQLAYGYKLQGPEDQFYKEAQLAAHNSELAGMQTNFFVNIFPALSYVPDWFPGTGWKRIAREWGVQQVKAKTEPYEWLKTQVANGTHQPSVLAPLLQGHKLMSELSLTERDERLKEVGFMTFGGGTDTSAYFLVNFVAAMVTNPSVQARAQQELDATIGPGVLPTISDKERLPYVRNLIDEVLRLYPILPLGAPHACFKDDTYRGYEIKKGTIVLGNAWAIGRDSRQYPNPGTLDPDRYLDPHVPRPPAFGWGRRKCPGIHFAETSVFITTALLLSTFTFSKRKDDTGREIIPQIEPEHNAIMFQLKPFDFEFKPRSEAHHQLILDTIGE